MELIFKQEAYEVIGACFEVYNELGGGFLEDVYQEALGVEFLSRQIPAVSHPRLEIQYKGCLLNSKYQPDFVAYSRIVIESKAVKSLADEHRAQVHNYLWATGFQLGLLVNFGKPGSLEYERIVRSVALSKNSQDSHDSRFP
ncbi:MAG: GxxExxY protein [Verrucomicrobiota bacterium]